MSENTSKIPVWFWIVSFLALLWNVAGIGAYIGDVSKSPEQLAKLPDEIRLLYENTPFWITSAYAIAVFGGALGCIALLLRRKLAFLLFASSLIAIIINNIYWFGIKNAIATTGAGYAYLQIAVFLIAVFLLWFSRSTTAKGWLR